MIYLYCATGLTALMCLLVDLYCRGYQAGRDDATKGYAELLTQSDREVEQVIRAFEILNRRGWTVVKIDKIWLVTYPNIMPLEMPPFMSEENPYDPVLLAEAWLKKYELECQEVTKI